MSLDHEPTLEIEAPAPPRAGEEPTAEPWHPASQYRSQPMVRWLSLREGLRGAQGEFFGGLFGAFADNREAQAARRQATVHCLPDTDLGKVPLHNDPLPFHRTNESTRDGLTADDSPLGPETSERWVDFVADIGDGFSPTYAIARQLARPSLDVDVDGSSRPLPRGDMLVLGGDEVYPVAGDQHYLERTIGPYRTAFRDVEERSPLFAIPGNHDWYDGLSAFLDRFTVLRPNGEEGANAEDSDRWTTHQTRSYFATQLNERWWIWGIDIALDAHIDTPQMEYFRDVRTLMPPGSRIILCTAKPAWLGRPPVSDRVRKMRALFGRISAGSASEPDAWDRLRYFTRHTLGDVTEQMSGPQIRLIISGDKHFYARHTAGTAGSGREPTLVTSGGGGAYLSSTLSAPPTVALPEYWESTDTTDFERRAVWPTPWTSWRIGLTGLWRLPLRNVSLALIFGAVYAALGLLAWGQRTDQESDLGEGVDELAFGSIRSVVSALGRSPTGLILVASVFVALFALAAAHGVPKWKALLVAVPHFVLHLVAVSFTIRLAASAARDDRFWAALLVPFGMTLILAADAVWRRQRDRSADWRPALLAALLTGVLALLLLLRSDDTSMLLFVVSLVGIGSALGIVTFSIYLVVVQVLHVNLNELFVGLRYEGYKEFLRLRVSEDEVEVFAIGYQRVARRHVTWQDDMPEVTQPTERATKEGHVLVDHFTVGT